MEVDFGMRVLMVLRDLGALRGQSGPVALLLQISNAEFRVPNGGHLEF